MVQHALSMASLDGKAAHSQAAALCFAPTQQEEQHYQHGWSEIPPYIAPQSASPPHLKPQCWAQLAVQKLDACFFCRTTHGKASGSL